MQANPNQVTVRTERYCLFAKLQAGRISFQLISQDLKVNEYNYYHYDMKIRSKTNNEECLQQYFHKIKESLEDQKKHILDMRKMTILFPFIKYSDPHTNNGQNQLWFTFRLCQDVDKDAIIKKLMKFGSSERLNTPKKISKKQNDKQLNKHQPAKSANKSQQHSSKNVKRNTQRAKQSRNSSESDHKDSEAVGKTKKIKKSDMKSKQEVKQKVIGKRKEQERKSEHCVKSNKLYCSQIKNRSENNPKSDYKLQQKLNKWMKKEPSTSTSIQDIMFKTKQQITSKCKQKMDRKDENKNLTKQIQFIADRQVKIQEQKMIMIEKRAETKWKSDSKSFNKFCICGSYVYFKGNNQWTQIAINTPISADDLVSSFKIQIKTCRSQEICVGVVTDWGLLSPCTQPRQIQDSIRHVEPPCSRYLIGRFNQDDIVECKIQWVSDTISWYVNGYIRAQLKVQWLKKWELFPCIEMKTKGDIIRWLY